MASREQIHVIYKGSGGGLVVGAPEKLWMEVRMAEKKFLISVTEEMSMLTVKERLCRHEGLIMKHLVLRFNERLVRDFETIGKLMSLHRGVVPPITVSRKKLVGRKHHPSCPYKIDGSRIGK